MEIYPPAINDSNWKSLINRGSNGKINYRLEKPLPWLPECNGDMGICGCPGMSWDVNATRWYLSVSENGVDFPKAYFNENMMNQFITGYLIFKICQNLPPNLAVAIQTFGQPTGGILMTTFNSQGLWVAQVFEHKPGWPSASNIFKSLGSSLPVAYSHCRSPVSRSSAVKLAILKTFGVPCLDKPI